MVRQAEIVVKVRGDSQHDRVGHYQPYRTVQIRLERWSIGLFLIHLHHLQVVVPPEAKYTDELILEHFGGHSKYIAVLSASVREYSG